jgi:hypothetical protein
MTAKGKINASNVQAGDRIIVKVHEGGLIRESATKTGENVIVTRVIGKTFRNAQGPYEARGKYVIDTADGVFEAAPIQTMFLAPEDAPGIKRAHVEALAEDKRINRAATPAEVAEAAQVTEVEAMRVATEAARHADTDEQAAEIMAAATGLPVEVAMEWAIANRPRPAEVAPASKCIRMDETVGTMTGVRAIRFEFTMKPGRGNGRHIDFDFYGRGANFNGAAYNRIEAAALRAMADAGLLDGVETFTHWLIR